jgi:hypothetical protein
MHTNNKSVIIVETVLFPGLHHHREHGKSTLCSESDGATFITGTNTAQ